MPASDTVFRSQMESTHRVLLLVKPFDVMSQDGGKLLASQLGGKVPSGSTEAGDLHNDGKRSDDSCNEVISSIGWPQQRPSMNGSADSRFDGQFVLE